MDWVGVVADAVGEFIHWLLGGNPVRTIIVLGLLAFAVFWAVRHYS